MFAVTSPWLCWTLLSVSLVGVTCADQKIEFGQNATLPCQSPNSNIITVEWSRVDLGKKWVLLYREGRLEDEEQHPSFKNRVDLQDRQMKDGDVSLRMMNVTINDTGTYECRVFMRETRLWKSINTTYLSVVVPPGHTGGHTEDRGKEDGGKEDGGKEDGGKEEGGKEDGGKEEGGKEDGGKQDKVNRHYGLVAPGLLLLVLLVVIASKLPKKNSSNHLPSDEPADICSEIRVSGG